MINNENLHNYEFLKTLGTGSLSSGQDYKIVTLQLGKYTVKVRVSGTNEFLGIDEISVNKEFLTIDQQVNTDEYIDVEKYYLDSDH